ncbi:MAG: histidine phosphatase family protein [Aestuariivirga sp.]
MSLALLIMRHAEKSPDLNDPHLTAAGAERATSLAAYIPAQFGKPDFIFVTANSIHSSRPFETVFPLSQAIGVPIDQSYADQDYGALALTLRQSEKYRNKVILVCWHHGNIPSLINAMGALPGSYSDPWPKTTFNIIIKLTIENDKVTQVISITEPF